MYRLILIFYFFISISIFAQQFLKGTIIVNFKKDIGNLNISHQDGNIKLGIASVDALLKKYMIIKMEREFPGETVPKAGSNLIDLTRYYILRYSKPFDIEVVIREFKNNPHFEYVGPAVIQSIDDNPNDSNFNNQWGMSRIQAPQAWTRAKADTTVRIAIIDTGVDWNHPDLGGSSPYNQGNIWINWVEWNGTTGVDDDGNGYIDDIRGWDFVDGISGAATGEDATMPDNDPMDFHGHGTHVAGIAAAMTNNSTGVAGVSGGWYSSQRGAQIMSLRAGWRGSDGGGYVSMIFCAQAISYARIKGATTINCSWTSSYTADLAAAVTNAINSGIIIVKSAGNSNTEDPDYLNSRGDCLSVAATNQDDIKADFSNYGTYVDISAPGVNIYSTLFNNTYGNMTGTSMAAPHVAGLVALVKKCTPSLSRSQVEQIIRLSVDNIDSQNPNYIGKLGTGRINAMKALYYLYVPQVYPTITSALSAAQSGQTLLY
jgi:subtilisin family serine protease